MDYPAELTNFVINNLGVTTQQTTYVITKFVESFGYLLAVNYGDINIFSRIPILRIMPEWLKKEYLSVTTLPKDLNPFF